MRTQKIFRVVHLRKHMEEFVLLFSLSRQYFPFLIRSFNPTNFLFGVVIGVILENFLLALFQAIEFRDISAFLRNRPTKSTMKFTLYMCAYLLIGTVSSIIILRILTNQHPVNGTAEVENT